MAEKVASRRVMEKLGMRCEGRLRENQRFKGRWWDAAVYGILEQEWQGTMGQEGAMKSQDVDREQIAQALPGAIEQLIASLEAGRTFDEAIGQLAATPDNALADAFGAMMAEVQAGARRREAMRGMAQRWDVPELTALTEGLITADQEGMPIVEVLRAQLR